MGYMKIHVRLQGYACLMQCLDTGSSFALSSELWHVQSSIRFHMGMQVTKYARDFGVLHLAQHQQPQSSAFTFKPSPAHAPSSSLILSCHIHDAVLDIRGEKGYGYGKQPQLGPLVAHVLLCWV